MRFAQFFLLALLAFLTLPLPAWCFVFVFARVLQGLVAFVCFPCGFARALGGFLLFAQILQRFGVGFGFSGRFAMVVGWFLLFARFRFDLLLIFVLVGVCFREGVFNLCWSVLLFAEVLRGFLVGGWVGGGFAHVLQGPLIVCGGLSLFAQALGSWWGSDFRARLARVLVGFRFSRRLW